MTDEASHEHERREHQERVLNTLIRLAEGWQAESGDLDYLTQCVSDPDLAADLRQACKLMAQLIELKGTEFE